MTLLDDQHVPRPCSLCVGNVIPYDVGHEDTPVWKCQTCGVAYLIPPLPRSASASRGEDESE